MKRFEKIAVVLIVLWFIQWISASLTPYWITKVIQNDLSSETTQMLTSVLGAVSVLIKSLTRLACGIWLYHQAKLEVQSRWIWCAVGLFFSISGIILFVAYLILGELRKTKSEPVV